jgi:diguanylate cyclase (GGDEF)-like protein/PAS domain S-box-containing protein
VTDAPNSTPEPSEPPAAPKAVLEVFDRAHAERLPVGVRDELLATMIALYPDVPLTPMQEHGLIVALPDSIEAPNPITEARAASDAIVYDEGLLMAWERVVSTGVGRSKAYPVGHPEITIMLYMLDVRETHGVLVSFAVMADVTPEELEAEREVYADLIPRFATIGKDARSNIVEVDEAITRILGWRTEELLGRRTLDIIHPDDHALAIDNWAEMMSVPGPSRRVRLRHKRNDGTWIWFEVTNHNLLADPEHQCVVCDMVDISEEMAAHEELRAREQLLDRITSTVPVGLLQVDEQRRVVYTNERLHEILGIERKDTAREQLANVITEHRPLLEQALDRVLADGAEGDLEVQLRLRADRPLRICTVSLRPLSHEDGTVSGAIACIGDVTDSARMREELKHRATFDDLTSCFNRASIMLALEANIATRQGDRAVVFVDVDRFKDVNDEHGHAVGDELLRVVAHQLRDGVRGDDLVGRIGGDEFLIVCPNIGGPERAMKLAQRLSAQVSRESIGGAASVAPRVSVGVAWSEGDSLDADTLVARADVAMYESKRLGAGAPQLARAA